MRYSFRPTDPAVPRMRAVALAVAFVMTGVLGLVCGPGVAMAAGADDFRTYADSVRGSEYATLSIIPWPTPALNFKFQVFQLTAMGCNYKIKGGSPGFDALLATLRDSVSVYEPAADPSAVDQMAEVRVGLYFWPGDRPPDMLYFNDTGGARDVDGALNDRRLLASRDLPAKLRAIAHMPGAIAAPTQGMICDKP